MYLSHPSSIILCWIYKEWITLFLSLSISGLKGEKFRLNVNYKILDWVWYRYWMRLFNEILLHFPLEESNFSWRIKVNTCEQESALRIRLFFTIYLFLPLSPPWREGTYLPNWCWLRYTPLLWPMGY